MCEFPSYEEWSKTNPVRPTKGKINGKDWEQPLDAALWEHRRMYESEILLSKIKAEK